MSFEGWVVACRAGAEWVSDHQCTLGALGLLQVLKTPVSRDMLGRVFNGSGRPIDGGCAAAWGGGWGVRVGQGD